MQIFPVGPQRATVITDVLFVLLDGGAFLRGAGGVAFAKILAQFTAVLMEAVGVLAKSRAILADVFHVTVNVAPVGSHVLAVVVRVGRVVPQVLLVVVQVLPVAAPIGPVGLQVATVVADVPPVFFGRFLGRSDGDAERDDSRAQEE